MKSTEKKERNTKQLIEKYCIKIMCVLSAGDFVREAFFYFHYFLMSIFLWHLKFQGFSNVSKISGKFTLPQTIGRDFSRNNVLRSGM